MDKVQPLRAEKRGRGQNTEKAGTADKDALGESALSQQLGSPVPA